MPGTLADTDHELVVWWDHNARKDLHSRFEDGKTYRIQYQGGLEDGVMGYYKGKCLHIGKVVKIEGPVKGVEKRVQYVLGLGSSHHFSEAEMDVAATLAEIATLPVDDRIQLVEAIWDSIASEPGQPELTEAQKRELERRLEAQAADPEAGTPWEQVKAQLLARARQ